MSINPFIVALLALLLPLSAQSQVLIKGWVLDANTKERLVGAHVYLLSDWRSGSVTNLEGEFTIDLAIAPSATDSLIVTYTGYEEQVVAVGTLKVHLNPKELIGETVVITAKPLIAEEFKYLNMQKMEIYTNPAAKADPILAVNSMAASTTADESANISLRGSTSLETGTFLNNTPIYDAVRYSQLNGIGSFSLFNTSIIKHVNVFPGNPPLEFGNTSAGVIALDTDDQVVEESSNAAILSLANIAFSRSQKINQRQSIKLFSNWQPSAVMKMVNNRALEDLRSFSSTDLGMYWYGSTSHFSWKTLAYGLAESYEYLLYAPTYNGSFYLTKQRAFVSNAMEVPIGKGALAFHQALSQSLGDFSYSNVAFEVLKQDLFSGISYLHNTTTLQVKGGLSYDARFSKTKGNFHEFGYAMDIDHPTVSYDGQENIAVLEGYIYAKYFLTDAIAVGAGMRKNLPQESERSYLSRQLNIAYNSNDWSIILGSGSYHKLGLNENTGGTFFAKNQQFSLDLKLNRQSKKYAFSAFSKNGSISSENYKVRGVEIFAAHPIYQKFMASGSLTLLNASLESDEIYEQDIPYFLRGSIRYRPNALWTIESNFLLRSGTLYHTVNRAEYDEHLEAFEPFYSEESSRNPNYANIGVSLNRTISVSDDLMVIVFASLNNALDRENVRTYRYNYDYSSADASLFSQRTAYLGLVLNF